MGASLTSANMNHHAMYAKPTRLPGAVAQTWLKEGLEEVGGMAKVVR